MDATSRIENIPLGDIRILNPRKRSPEKARELLESIRLAGLKRPITVSRSRGENGDLKYDLVCGQGRLEAVRELGWPTIPAIVIEVPEEVRYLMSLAENLARVRRSGVERLRQIAEMEKRGLGIQDIVQSTGLAASYVGGILHLLKAGEESLVQSVEHGLIPLAVAVDIAKSDDQAIQKALQEAYESGQLSAAALGRARRLVERRAAPAGGQGGDGGGAPREDGRRARTADEIVRAYRKEAERQVSLIRKNEACETRLRVVVSALQQLFADENFTNLLKAEALGTYPRNLAELVQGKGA